MGHCFGSHVAMFISSRLNGKWKYLGTVEKIRGSENWRQNGFVLMDKRRASVEAKTQN
jgi:hypothetical protein